MTIREFKKMINEIPDVEEDTGKEYKIFIWNDTKRYAQNIVNPLLKSISSKGKDFDPFVYIRLQFNHETIYSYWFDDYEERKKKIFFSDEELNNIMLKIDSIYKKLNRSCLCGHFEFCDTCNPLVQTTEQLIRFQLDGLKRVISRIEKAELIKELYFIINKIGDVDNLIINLINSI